MDEIYCPKCHWEPRSHDQWECSCRHAWHTFDTHGRCPRCGIVWRDTQCPACHIWSRHHDWYHNLPSVDVDAIVETADEPYAMP
jgi:hypothetical protein